jgi:SAM-dependent methyltransferase
MTIETLEIESDRGLLKVHWSDINTLAVYGFLQSGRYGIENFIREDFIKEDSLEVTYHKIYFKGWHQNCWDFRKQLGAYDLPNGSRILDIGCGLAVVDLLLYSYVPKSEFFLLDKFNTKFLDINPNDVSYSKNHPFYHSWDPITDAIKTSNFDEKRFTLLNPEDNFPEDLDLIMSSFSWCFHYPKEVYWDKVVNSLKTGGKLYLDVRSLTDRDAVGEISEALKSKPIISPIPKIKKIIDHYPNNLDVTGYRCVWIKNA